MVKMGMTCKNSTYTAFILYRTEIRQGIAAALHTYAAVQKQVLAVCLDKYAACAYLAGASAEYNFQNITPPCLYVRFPAANTRNLVPKAMMKMPRIRIIALYILSDIKFLVLLMIMDTNTYHVISAIMCPR